MNILMKDGKIFFDGETIGEFDQGDIQEIRVDGQTFDRSQIVVNGKPLDTRVTMAMLASTITPDYARMIEELEKKVSGYGRCIDCGNKAKGHHCFKCQQKRQHGQ